MSVLVLKNKYGEESSNTVMPGSTYAGITPIAANTIPANLTGSSAVPTPATYAAVGAKLPPTMLLTGFTAGAGTVGAGDTVIAAIQKLAGNKAAHQANSTASDVAGLVVDFNALLAKLQAANLMA